MERLRSEERETAQTMRAFRSFIRSVWLRVCPAPFFEANQPWFSRELPQLHARSPLTTYFSYFPPYIPLIHSCTLTRAGLRRGARERTRLILFFYLDIHDVHQAEKFNVYICVERRNSSAQSGFLPSRGAR